MLITTQAITKIDHSLTEKLTKLFVETFLQLSIYAGRDKLLFDTIAKEIRSFNESNGSRHLIIAKDKEKIIGLIFIDLLKDGAVYLAQGAISTSYQRQGIAKEMLKTFLMLHFNITGAFVLTREGNHAAVKLYENNGFKRALEIYARHPFLKAMGYDYPPYVPFEISLPLIKKHYPGIFKFSETKNISTITNKQKEKNPDTALRRITTIRSSL